MFHFNRDLLAINPRISEDKYLLEKEIELINGLLKYAETLDSFCVATEVIDINLHKIIRKPAVIIKHVQAKILAPFIFFYNRN
jgi:hypothetical protein